MAAPWSAVREDVRLLRSVGEVCQARSGSRGARAVSGMTAWHGVGLGSQRVGVCVLGGTEMEWLALPLRWGGRGAVVQVHFCPTSLLPLSSPFTAAPVPPRTLLRP